jgi:hypothetical protein
MSRSPRRRSAAGAVAVFGGALALLVGLRADRLGLGDAPGASWKQDAAVAIGVLSLCAGLFLVRGWLAGLPRHVRRERWLPFVVALAIYGGMYAVGYENITPRGDEPHYMLEAISLAVDRDRNLAGDYADPARFGPMFGPLVPSVHAYNYFGDPSVAVSWHGVGLPAMLVPAAAISSSPRLMRIEMIIVAALTAYLLLSVLRRLAGGGPLVYAVWAGVAFALPLLSYSSQVYPELPGALLLLLGVRLLLSEPLLRRHVAGVSIVAGLLPWFHFRFGLLSLALVAAALARTRRRWLAAAVGPFLAGIGLLALAHQHWYGSPSPTAPTRLQEPRPEFDLPWAYSHSLGGVLQPVYGWLPFAPLHLLAFVGAIYLCFKRSWWALFATAVAVVYLFAVGSAKPAGGGFAFPARYQLILIPLAALPLLLLLLERRSMWVPAAVLGALTVALSVAGAVRIDALVTKVGPDEPALPIASDLAVAWPHIAPREDEPYPDIPKTLAWSGGILLAGFGLTAGIARRGRRAPT